MKKRVFLTLLGITIMCTVTACGKKNSEQETLTPKDYQPQCYEFSNNEIDEDELPDDTYYIVRKTKKKTIYYPVYSNCETSIEAAPDSCQGADPERIIWVNYNLDEGLVPVMKKGDSFIYKSSTYIPTTYAIEKFYDWGYTFGVCGLQSDLSGNYQYLSAAGEKGIGRVHTTSDASGFDRLEADSVYFASINNKKLTSERINPAGGVDNLKLMKKYKCDIRSGTVKNDVTLTANIRLFSSAETYMGGNFSFMTPYIVKIDIPDYMTTGYYNVNAGGFFKYEKDDSKNNNETIYTYDEYGSLNGAKIDGVLKKFDENGFIVDYDEKNKEESEEKPVVARTKWKNGYFMNDFYVSYVSKMKTDSNGSFYEITTTSMDGTDGIVLKYYTKDKNFKDIKEGNSYKIAYDLNYYSGGYGIVKKYKLSGKNVQRPLTEQEESDEEAVEENTTQEGVSNEPENPSAESEESNVTNTVNEVAAEETLE